VDPYADRRAAGRELAGHLGHHRDPLVVGIPPGGVVVADEVATMIGGTLGVIPVLRLGAPESPNLVVGAIGFGGEVVLDRDLVARLGIEFSDLEDQVTRARAWIGAEADALGAGPTAVTGRDVIVVDEGAASGLRLRAVLDVVRRRQPARLACAVGVAPPATVDLLADEVDEVVCPRQPLRLGSIEDWFRRFPPVDRDGVRLLLERW
jgi:predicted phosphoribosyltransferase